MEKPVTSTKAINKRSATKWITFYLIMMYALQLTVKLTSGYDEMYDYLAVWKPSIEDGAWWRLITYAMVHGSPFHLLRNAACMYSVGYWIEGKIKGFFIQMIFWVGVVGGGYLGMMTTALPIMGASAGIFALSGAWLIFLLRFGTKKDKVSWIVIVLIDIGLSLLPQIALYAHIGGLMAGLALGILLFALNKRVARWTLQETEKGLIG